MKKSHEDSSGWVTCRNIHFLICSLKDSTREKKTSGVENPEVFFIIHLHVFLVDFLNLRGCHLIDLCYFGSFLFIFRQHLPYIVC